MSYAVVERPTHAALPDVRTALLMQRIENGEVHPVPYIGAVPETSPRRPPGFIEPALELV
ncbi:MAG: hypothetical protein ACRDSL_07505 [Pseudonocardiaceae bacterium]